jgi:SAM-dependent methyltransferase
MTDALWPLPALLAWAACWLVFAGLRALDTPLPLALALAAALGAALAGSASTPWRRVFVALGFPLSLLASGLAAGVPAWVWLAPLLVLALAYPVRAWRDAPLFPTPPGVLAGLERLAPLAAEARILDAGCGLGDGLLELHRRYPQARIEGIEWSWPLCFAAALRCRFARVRRRDMWAADWSAYAMVYLFQRPESMAGAWDKAVREMAPGSWLASLEFAVPSRAAEHTIEREGGRRVFLYRVADRRVAERRTEDRRKA